MLRGSGTCSKALAATHTWLRGGGLRGCQHSVFQFDSYPCALNPAHISQSCSLIVSPAENGINVPLLPTHCATQSIYRHK